MLKIHVKVKPGARESRLEQAADGSWRAMVKAPPVDGKANAELLKLVARHFKVPCCRVAIAGGKSGTLKCLHIEQ